MGGVGIETGVANEDNMPIAPCLIWGGGGLYKLLARGDHHPLGSAFFLSLQSTPYSMMFWKAPQVLSRFGGA